MSEESVPSQSAIARAAGLSRSTVSRALSDHPGTNKDTKKLVRETAERLGYKKNAVVSMLTAQIRASKLQRTKSTLAYLTTLAWTPRIPVINSTYHLFFEGARKRAEELGYGIDTVWLKESAMTGSRMTKILKARGIRGILIPPRPTPLSHITLDWREFSAACIGHALPAPKLHLAVAHHTHIIETALRMCRKYHYKRVGFAVWPSSDRYTQHAFSSRFLFYQSSTPSKSRLAPLYDPVHGGDDSFIDLPKIRRWIEKQKPDVIIGVGSQMLEAIRSLGFSIPGDLAYIDLNLAPTDGSCAGIFEGPEVIAASAVDLVIEQIHHNQRGVPLHPKSVAIDGKWVDGKTLPKR